MDQFWSVFVRAVYVLLKVANKKAVDNPHIKMPVNPSTGPNSRHSFGSIIPAGVWGPPRAGRDGWSSLLTQRLQLPKISRTSYGRSRRLRQIYLRQAQGRPPGARVPSTA